MAKEVVIIGAGRIGRILAAHLGASAALLSARDLITGKTRIMLKGSAGEGAALLFAHGADVNTQNFRDDYAQLLESRLAPLRIAAATAPGVRAILISSTVAALGRRPEPSLCNLQLDFEAAFLSSFARSACILRAATLIDDESQLVAGIARLQKSLLLKRLRVRGGTAIPWTDGATLCAAAMRALGGDGPDLIYAAQTTPLDINRLLDSAGDGGPVLHIPKALYAWVFARLGIRPEFYDVTMDHLAPAPTLNLNAALAS